MANQRKDTDHPVSPESDPSPHSTGGARPSKPAPVTATLTATVTATSAEEPGAARGNKPAAAAPVSANGAEDERVEYRPNRKVHLTAAGPCALGNWVGRVGNKFVRVYRGAQASGIPEAVVTAMAASGIEVGVITHEELGLRQPPATTLLRR